jgi:hypothetical protein
MEIERTKDSLRFQTPKKAEPRATIRAKITLTRNTNLKELNKKNFRIAPAPEDDRN